MDNFEIVERIAGIVGCKYEENCVIIHDDRVNPLIYSIKANAWCYDLMAKFGVELSPVKTGGWVATYADKYDVYGHIVHDECYSYAHRSSNMAVLRVIIDAHRGSHG